MTRTTMLRAGEGTRTNSRTARVQLSKGGKGYTLAARTTRPRYPIEPSSYNDAAGGGRGAGEGKRARAASKIKIKMQEM
eukprot:scaffold98432_cov33-Tisochrysis_lutea.AAC.6